MTFSLVPFAFLLQVGSSSRIATFTDSQCKNAFQSLDAENGYPNGTCTRLADQGKYGSFQVVGLDPGCSATIYGADSEEFVPCSSTVLQFTSIGDCHNSSFVYYSIDACTPPSEISSSSRSATPSATPSTSPSSTPSPSVASKPRKSNTGVIAGGVVGGVCGLALIAAAVFLLLRRTKKPGQPPEAPVDERREVDGRSAMAEMPHQGPKHEMDSKNIAPQELGDKKSVDLPPVELPGDDATRHSQHIIDSQLTASEKR